MGLLHRFRDKDKIGYKRMREEIKKIAQEQALTLVTGLDPFGEAKRIRKSFKLDQLDRIGEQIGTSGRYPPNVFPAVGVLLDSYPPELAAFMVAFGFPGGLRACIMMFLEDIEKIEQAREKLLGKKKRSRINQAAKVIANMLCLMDSKSIARETFYGMVNPSMKDMVKKNLYQIAPEVAKVLIEQDNR